MSYSIATILPPEGEQYGFPKEIPDDLQPGRQTVEWLIENGYPGPLVAERGVDSLPCKYHVEAVVGNIVDRYVDKKEV